MFETYEIKIPKKVAATDKAHYTLYDLVEVLHTGGERIRDMLAQALKMTGREQAVYSEGKGLTSHMLKIWEGQEYYAVYSGKDYVLNGPDGKQCHLTLKGTRRLNIGYGQNESSYDYHGDSSLVNMFLYDLFAENPAGYGAASVTVYDGVIIISQSASCD